MYKRQAVCHVDQTARVQTITKENGLVFDILSEYKNLSGVSVLVNTSFNDNDEPIVFTKLDALCAFLNCNADILIINDKLINRCDIVNEGNVINAAEKLSFEDLDVVIGSRFASGASIKGLSQDREKGSIIANKFARYSLSRNYRNIRGG